VEYEHFYTRDYFIFDIIKSVIEGKRWVIRGLDEVKTLKTIGRGKTPQAIISLNEHRYEMHENRTRDTLWRLIRRQVIEVKDHKIQLSPELANKIPRLQSK
jgi:hypothetical protein